VEAKAEALLRKKLEAEAISEAFDFLRSRKRKHFYKTWGSRDVEAVKFLWKHFEERSWKQTWKRPTLYGAGSGRKKYSTASTFLI